MFNKVPNLKLTLTLASVLLSLQCSCRADSGLLCLQSKESSSNSRSAPKPRVNDGLKMRASVRMTRYLESWGAVKPFAHLQNTFAADAIGNGKARSRASGRRSGFRQAAVDWVTAEFDILISSLFQDIPLRSAVGSKVPDR